MPARSLRIVNESSHHSGRVVAAIDAIRKAVNIQLRDVAREWGEYVYTVVDDARRQGFNIVLLDDPDAADALGYHDLDRDGDRGGNGIPPRIIGWRMRAAPSSPSSCAIPSRTARTRSSYATVGA